MKKHNFLTLSVALLIGQACINNNSKTETKSDTLKESTILLNESNIDGDEAFFLKQVAISGLKEVEAAKVALRKTKNKKITDFSKMIITDHTKIDKKVKQLALDNKIILPDELNPQQKVHLSKLNNISNNFFDQTYLDMMNKDHYEDIKMFEDNFKTLRDKDILNFIKQTLPTLKKHAEPLIQ